MAQETSTWGSRPISPATEEQDPLEKQLEGLFSDVVLPEPPFGPGAATATAAPRRRSRTARPTAHRQWLTPGWRPLVQRLAALAPFVALAFLLTRGLPFRSADARENAESARAVSVALSRPADATPGPVSTALVSSRGESGPSQLSSTPSPAGATSSAAPTATATQAVPTPTADPSTALPDTFTSTPTARATPTATGVPPTQIVAPTPLPPATATPAAPSPTRLRIPAVGLDAPIETVGFINYQIQGQPVTSWAVPTHHAAGWHHSSALPGGGGNVVLNGHQYVHGGVFRDLAALRADDEIVVYVGETAHRYRVTERHLLQEAGQPLAVRAANARWILPTDDERLTLVTCAPDAQATHRLIVVALPVPAAPSTDPPGQ